MPHLGGGAVPSVGRVAGAPSSRLTSPPEIVKRRAGRRCLCGGFVGDLEPCPAPGQIDDCVRVAGEPTLGSEIEMNVDPVDPGRRIEADAGGLVGLAFNTDGTLAIASSDTVYLLDAGVRGLLPFGNRQ